MNNFEKVAAPEMLGAFLSSLHIATGPWDESFHRTFCDSCEREDCDVEHCLHQTKRNNPTWWSKLGGPSETRALEPGVIVKLENPLRVNIRAARHESLLSEMLDGENAGARLKAAWQTAEMQNRRHRHDEMLPSGKVRLDKYRQFPFGGV